MRRALVWSLGILVVVLLVFYVGGGWYFAGQINSTALEVSHDDPDRSLEVVASSNRTVTLMETGIDVPALADASTYGCHGTVAMVRSRGRR